MITKVGLGLDKNYNGFSSANKQNKLSNPMYKGSYESVDTVSFTGLFDRKSKEERKKIEDVMYRADYSTKELISVLKKEAKAEGYSSVTPLFVLKHELVELDKYLSGLKSGAIDPDTSATPYIVALLEDNVTVDLLATPEYKDKVQNVTKKNIDLLDKILQKSQEGKKDNKKEPELSQDLVDLLWSYEDDDDLSGNGNIIPSNLINSVFDSSDTKIIDTITEILQSYRYVMFRNDSPVKNRVGFSLYEKSVDNILKNLSLGTNMFVTYDQSKTDPRFFVNTLRKTIEKNNNDGNGGKKVNVLELNDMTTSNYFDYNARKLGRDKSQENIIIVNLASMINSKDDLSEFSFGSIDKNILDAVLKQPSNVKYIFYGPEEAYYSIADSTSSYVLDNVQNISIPSLDTVQMIKMFNENPSIMKDVPVPFEKDAIEKAIEASSQLDGVFPKKSLDLMKKIASYNINKTTITEQDVATYVQEATHLFKKSDDDSSVNVIFDTGKKIRDMVGKPSTQKEAMEFVKQIKSHKLGTKGVVIFSQDGAPGGGRRYTAKAIAGEAKVPYIEINTADFGTKDVSIFGGESLSPQASMKKLFSLVRTQAEANPDKSAVLFIENFEYFSVGEMLSEYLEKAMAQLLREMEKADDAGLNILVAGSVSDPKMIGEAMLKSFKFIDKLEVATPAIDKSARADVIRFAIKENNIQIENENLIDYAASIAHKFPFIKLKNLVKKAQSIASERGHEVINKADITEAYLQITLGRPTSVMSSEHDKRNTALHECGHAVNLEVMRGVTQRLGRPWHDAGKVGFITLDPRGYYGGAVYSNSDDNEVGSFESMFGDLVMSFGGCSAENLFMNMQGSVGIGIDMEMARQTAEYMVTSMGLGAKTGHMTIFDGENLSEEMKRMIEQDERVILNNARLTSDYITEVYSDFNKWFTDKYAKLVGTGDCLIPGDEFRAAFEKWKSEQPLDKQAQFRECEETVMKVIEATKKGLMVRKRD